MKDIVIGHKANNRYYSIYKLENESFSNLLSTIHSLNLTDMTYKVMGKEPGDHPITSGNYLYDELQRCLKDICLEDAIIVISAKEGNRPISFMIDVVEYKFTIVSTGICKEWRDLIG